MKIITCFGSREKFSFTSKECFNTSSFLKFLTNCEVNQFFLETVSKTLPSQLSCTMPLQRTPALHFFMNWKHFSPQRVLPDAHVNSCTGKSAANSGELWASTLKSGIYRKFYRSWRSRPGQYGEKAEPIQVCFRVTCKQSLKVCGVKANHEKFNEGCSVSVSSPGIRQLRERNYIHWAQRTGVLSLLSCKRKRALEEKMSFSRTVAHCLMGCQHFRSCGHVRK